VNTLDIFNKVEKSTKKNKITILSKLFIYNLQINKNYFQYVTINTEMDYELLISHLRVVYL